MNWLAFETRAMSGAVLGCALAVLAALYVDGFGATLPWSTGLLAGLGSAALARERSGPRGLVVGALATWTGALADVLTSHGAHDLGAAVSTFHTTLTPAKAAAWALGVAIAVLLGGRALRRGAHQRVAGA
jgi:hypothetical protein